MIITDKKYGRENLMDSGNKIADGYPHQNKLLQNYTRNSERDSWLLIRKRKRLVVQRGMENIFTLLDDIVLFYTKNKIVYVVDRLGQRYIAKETLAFLEEELDSGVFFRANRQFIISVNHIKSFRTYERVKLKVNMNPDELNDQHFIIISQETAPSFRKWIYAA